MVGGVADVGCMLKGIAEGVNTAASGAQRGVGISAGRASCTTLFRSGTAAAVIRKKPDASPFSNLCVNTTASVCTIRGCKISL